MKIVGFFCFLSYKQGEQKAFASLTQQVTWSCWKNWFRSWIALRREKCPSMHLFSSSLLHNLVLPLFREKRWFHSLSPLWVPDAQCNERGSRVGMNTLPWCLHRQGSHLTPSPPSANANRSFYPPSLLSALPLLWLQKTLVCPRNSIPSLQSLAALKKFSISFWRIQPSAWNLFYQAGERAPDLTSACSTAPLSAPCGSSQPEQPAQPILTSQLTCQILLGNSGTEWLKLFQEWK